MEDQPFNTTPAPSEQPQQPVVIADTQRSGIGIMTFVVSVLLLGTAGVISAIALWHPGTKHSTVTTKTTPDTAVQTESSDSATSSNGQVAEIDIDKTGITPDSLTVTPGTTVMWNNKDSAAHTITGDDLGGNNALDAGSSFMFTYTQPGDYSYSDGSHSGTITVRE